MLGAATPHAGAPAPHRGGDGPPARHETHRTTNARSGAPRSLVVDPHFGRCRIGPMFVWSAPVIDADGAAPIEARDRVWLWRTAAGGSHPRRIEGHPGHRKPEDGRALTQQPLDRIGRDVAFEDISIHQRRVTGLQRPRDTMPGLDRLQVAGVFGFHREPVLSQVAHPRVAAASGGRLVYRHRKRRVGPRRERATTPDGERRKTG